MAFDSFHCHRGAAHPTIFELITNCTTWHLLINSKKGKKNTSNFAGNFPGSQLAVMSNGSVVCPIQAQIFLVPGAREGLGYTGQKIISKIPLSNYPVQI